MSNFYRESRRGGEKKKKEREIQELKTTWKMNGHNNFPGVAKTPKKLKLAPFLHSAGFSRSSAPLGEADTALDNFGGNFT